LRWVLIYFYAHSRPKHAFGLGLYDRTKTPESLLMREPGIKHLTGFALFLPFWCSERLQTATSQCKVKTLEVIGKMKKTGMNG